MRKNKLSRRILVILALFFALGLFVSPQAEAKKKTKQRVRRIYTLDAGLGISYNDNIINYSDADLEVFSSDTLKAKFAIESKDDWILTPSVRPRFQTNLISGMTATLDLGFDYYYYVSNEVRRFSRYSIAGSHYFSERGYGKLSYSYIPKYYYRNIFNSTDNIFSEAKFSKHAFSAEIGYEITKTIKGSAAYNYQNKYFNSEFNYRDLKVNGFGLDGIWRVSRMFKVWASYGFERAVAKGADMPDTILDVSYDAWDILFGARHYSPLLEKIKPEIFSTFQFRNINFQSNKFPDLFRYGREDNNYQFKFGTACRLPHNIRLEAEYSFSQKKASLPDIYPDLSRNIPETTKELERKLNYKSNSIALRFLRQF